MDEYLVGVVKEYQLAKIIFESNKHGFIFQGVNLHLLPINQEIKLYIYLYQRVAISEYFAFLNQETKQYFLELISVSCVGPKIALKILNFFNLEQFKTIVSVDDVVVLQKVKGVTNKLALAIINHFKFKNNLYAKDSYVQKKWFLVFDALRKLGFSKNIINKYLNSITINNIWNNDLQIIIDQAVKEINNEYY